LQEARVGSTPSRAVAVTVITAPVAVVVAVVVSAVPVAAVVVMMM
jgi:hypothetical protein